ncbi:hypothetical protein BC827DRAFT_726668 [Russula dissimulans]|nr:hypothetical protein BC827DRAFT_726668 [Russula dissimulans]
MKARKGEECPCCLDWTQKGYRSASFLLTRERTDSESCSNGGARVTRGGSTYTRTRTGGGCICYPLPLAGPRVPSSPAPPAASPRDLFPGRGLRGASGAAPDRKSSQEVELESPVECPPCCPLPPAACVVGANCGHSNVSGGARKSNSISSPTPPLPAGPNTFAKRSSGFGPKWCCEIRGGCRDEDP